MTMNALPVLVRLVLLALTILLMFKVAVGLLSVRAVSTLLDMVELLNLCIRRNDLLLFVALFLEVVCVKTFCNHVICDFKLLVVLYFNLQVFWLMKKSAEITNRGLS